MRRFLKRKQAKKWLLLIADRGLKDTSCKTFNKCLIRFVLTIHSNILTDFAFLIITS